MTVQKPSGGMSVRLPLTDKVPMPFASAIEQAFARLNPSAQIPAGGLLGQLLMKTDQRSFNTSWGPISVGSGAPGASTPGVFYFRTDTPTVANQRLYVNQSGTWVGIL